jgi:hypothetical protein
MQLLLSAISAGGLVGASNQYLCLLLVSVAAKTGLVTLAQPMGFMESWWFIGIVAFFWLLTVAPAYATTLGPGVMHVVNTVANFLSGFAVPVSAALLSLAAVGIIAGIDPTLRDILTTMQLFSASGGIGVTGFIVAGGSAVTASALTGARFLSKPALSTATGTAGTVSAPIYATIENVASVVLMALVLLLTRINPWLLVALFALVALLILGALAFAVYQLWRLGKGVGKVLRLIDAQPKAGLAVVVEELAARGDPAGAVGAVAGAGGLGDPGGRCRGGGGAGRRRAAGDARLRLGDCGRGDRHPGGVLRGVAERPGAAQDVRRSEAGRSSGARAAARAGVRGDLRGLVDLGGPVPLLDVDFHPLVALGVRDFDELADRAAGDRLLQRLRVNLLKALRGEAPGHAQPHAHQPDRDGHVDLVGARRQVAHVDVQDAVVPTGRSDAGPGALAFQCPQQRGGVFCRDLAILQHLQDLEPFLVCRCHFEPPMQSILVLVLYHPLRPHPR